MLSGSFNPEAKTLAERIREASATAVTTTEPIPDTAVPAFTLVDRFGGDIGSFAECAMSVIDTKDPYKDVDPSQCKDMFENPSSYEEAWNHKDPFQRKLWREAITKELTKMAEKKVWRKIKRSEMEKDRRCVKYKWVLEIK